MAEGGFPKRPNKERNRSNREVNRPVREFNRPFREGVSRPASSRRERSYRPGGLPWRPARLAPVGRSPGEAETLGSCDLLEGELSGRPPSPPCRPRRIATSTWGRIG